MRALCVAILAFSAGVTAQESFLSQAIGQWNNTNDAYQKIQDCKLTVDFIEAKMSVQVLDECDLNLLSAYVLQNECRLERLDNVEINSEWSSKRFNVNGSSCSLLGEGYNSGQAAQNPTPPEQKPEPDPEARHGDSIEETYRDALQNPAGDSYVLQYYGSTHKPDLSDLACLKNDFVVVKEQGMYYVWSTLFNDYDQAVALGRVKKAQCPEIPNWVKRLSGPVEEQASQHQYKRAMDDPNVFGYVLQFYNGRKMPALSEFSCLGDEFTVIKERGTHYVWSRMFDSYSQAKAQAEITKLQCPSLAFWIKTL